MGTALGDLAKTPGVPCGITRQVTGSSDGGPAQRPLQTAGTGSGGRTAQQRARRSQRLSAVRGDSKTERPRPEVYRVPVSATPVSRPVLHTDWPWWRFGSVAGFDFVIVSPLSREP